MFIIRRKERKAARMYDAPDHLPGAATDYRSWLSMPVMLAGAITLIMLGILVTHIQ